MKIKLTVDKVPWSTFGYIYNGTAGETLFIRRGALLTKHSIKHLRKDSEGKWLDRWYIYKQREDGFVLVGDEGGYDRLKDVREHIEAVEIDRSNGHEVIW